ncbi:MAG: 4-oxalocrotonate tautomerase [Peptococcaceae bacterium BRH_c4a]|nr:MAG: 4-oxalocrotonate tautomerase [Peptococcaceae bacterium BRH_c4a]
MPTIQISILEGRTLEQKRQLVKGITEVVVNTCNAKPEKVTIYINEIKKENSAKAGILRSDR